MPSADLQSTTRFSSRVADYVKYRPDYPRPVIDRLREICGLNSEWIVADIGCGTGISARMFLENGNTVLGVEPNADMRCAAEAEFARHPRFRPISGTAEATTLADSSVDLVIAAQAFHWFDRPACAREWKRILRGEPGGWVVLMWNTRLDNADAFAIEYDALLNRHGTDYRMVAHRTPIAVEELSRLFGAPFQRIALANSQSFDYEGLAGRVRSSSYTPLPGQPGHDELFAGLRRGFDRHQQRGQVQFHYETEVFLGRVERRSL